MLIDFLRFNCLVASLECIGAQLVDECLGVHDRRRWWELWSDHDIIEVYGFVILVFILGTRRLNIRFHCLEGGIVILLARIRMDVTFVGGEERAGHPVQAACLVLHVFPQLHNIVVTSDSQHALLCT